MNTVLQELKDGKEGETFKCKQIMKTLKGFEGK